MLTLVDITYKVTSPAFLIFQKENKFSSELINEKYTTGELYIHLLEGEILPGA